MTQRIKIHCSPHTVKNDTPIKNCNNNNVPLIQPHVEINTSKENLNLIIDGKKIICKDNKKIVESTAVLDSIITDPLMSTVGSGAFVKKYEKKSLVESIIQIIGTKSNSDMDYKNIILCFNIYLIDIY